MELKHHFIVSFILSIVLYPFFGFNVLYIFVGGFLIDIDHYLLYIFKFKDFSIKKTFEYSKNFSALYKFHIFHLFEVLVVCVILSFYSKTFLLISIGLIFHQILDFYELKYIDRNLNLRVHSLFQLPIMLKQNEYRNHCRGR
jgi:hypothetical protein